MGDGVVKLFLEKSDGKVEDIVVGASGEDIHYCRLSEAPLWGMMHRLFNERGVGLWTEGDIPSRSSSNSFIAHSKSRLAATFLEEHNPKTNTAAKKTRYILEIGSGSGRFAYNFLQHFYGPEGTDPLVENTVYIMSDIAEANINFWRDHKQFRPFVEAGVLDFAHFDAVHDDALTLAISGEKITENTVETPLVTIANYIIDSIPSDLFAASDGQLYEKLCGVQQALDPNEMVKGVKFFYRTKKITEKYYDVPQWNEVMNRYAGHDETFQFSLPVGGFALMDTMRKFAGGAYMMLVSDYGALNLAAIKRNALVNVNNNGNSTVAVNFDALRGYTEDLGGKVLQFEGAYSAIASCGYLFGGGASPLTMKRYHDHFTAFGPDDYDALHSQWAQSEKNPALREAIYLTKLAKYDVKMFLVCRRALILGARRAGEKNLPLLSETLLSIADKVWQHYYHLDPKNDPALELAQMYLPLGMVDKAREVLLVSCDYNGSNPNKEIMLERCRKAEAKR